MKPTVPPEPRPTCDVCGKAPSPNGRCHRCLEIKALASAGEPGFYNVVMVLGDGLPLPKLEEETP